MAGIKSLSLRGIRSFGPEDNDEQRISFESPLTLILGQNGCGKTTIIECLQYAITGQMPPGSRNECFVHDTKVNRSAEVLAQIKLKIINAKDKQLAISRSMKVTALPKKKPKFQTLDSFLSIIDDNGRPNDISSRCTDISYMIQQELGVSKAIINSVILCHQEDSEWPLDEGKKVKERFDEIFDADKYSDCFEKLKKIRKEYAVTIKVLTVEVAHLLEKKEELDKKKLDLVNTETRISDAEAKVSELTAQLTPINDKIRAIEKLQKDLVAFESKKDKIKTKLEHNKSKEEELKKAIKDTFEGTIEELEMKIDTYGTSTEVRKKELDESHKKIFNFNKDEEKMANEMSANEVKYNKLMLLESQHQERMDKRNKMVVDTAKLADLDLADVESDEQASEGINSLTEKIKALNAELKQQKSLSDAEEKKLQLAIYESRDVLSRHKQKILNKETEIEKHKKDILNTNKEITKTNESKQRLEALEQKLSEAEEQYTNAVAELNTEECQKEINDDEKLMEEHDRDLEVLNEKISTLQKQTAKLKERDMIEEQLKTKEKQINVLKNKHRSALTELLGKMPESNFAVAINKLECETRPQLDSMKKQLKEKQSEITTLEADRKHVREMINNRRKELTVAEDKMYKACGTQTYDATLAKYNTNVEKLQEEQNLLQSSLFIIDKYKKQLEENNSCPLCNRGFDSSSEVMDLVSDLTTKVMNVPAKLEKVTEELQKASAKKDELLALKSLSEQIVTLKEQEVPQLEKRLADVDKNIIDLNETVEELNILLAEPEQKLQTAKQLQGDMPLLDKLNNEIQATTKSLNNVKDQCAEFETDITLDDASEKQAELRSKINELKSKIKASQNKLNAHNKKLQKLSDAKNKLKEQMLNIQKKVQELFNLQESLKQLEESKDKCLLELNELQDGTEALEADLKQKQDVKTEAVNKNRNAIEVKRSYISKIESSFEKVKAILKEIKQHEERNVPKEMQKIKDANEKLMQQKKQIMIDRSEITKKIDSLKDELAKHEIYKRDLKDNLNLRKAQAEIESAEKELAEIEEKMSGVDVTMLPEKGPLITKQTQIFRDKAQTEGQLKELKDRLKANKLELAKAQNKNLESNYKEKYYDLEITKTLDKDLREYAVALEKCVMEFHRDKMENINLIIKGMWRKIYRGNDIDYIEIKTESSMTADSERRKYDYRVVQSKNGVEIDMRGRCSAGQKVLACLIIRLALAETFSSRFGILALDEPTTNLDQENVRSLCSALAEIVQERMRQKNFMFIIITHDKEFIDSLGSIDKVTHYYEVSRNDDGKSRIKKIRFT